MFIIDLLCTIGYARMDKGIERSRDLHFRGHGDPVDPDLIGRIHGEPGRSYRTHVPHSGRANCDNCVPTPNN